MIALRVLTGTALVALYTIIESWLNSQAPREQRGRIFAIYMMVNLGALALAQQLLRLDEATAFTLFAVSAVLVCLAVMPVSATRLVQPEPGKAAHFSLRLLMRAAPLAVAGGLLSGLAMGAFWGMGAVYAGRIGLADDGVALFMSAAILGGALLQWPLGAFSDQRDRRLALAVVALAAALARVCWRRPRSPAIGRSARSRSTAGWPSRFTRSRSPCWSIIWRPTTCSPAPAACCWCMAWWARRSGRWPRG